MSVPKYERGDEPGLDVVHVTDHPDTHDGYEVQFSGENWADTREEAEVFCQEYAIAIADSVHGAELARLRAVEDSYLDLVKRLRTVIIHTLSDCKAANLALTDRFAIEVFDEASIALGLPISNDDGVPFELLPPVPAGPFKPTMTRDPDVLLWVVRWGASDDDTAVYNEDEHESAAADFGERYAAWKAGQR